LRNTALSWIIVSVSDNAEMMEKSSGNGFSVGLGLTNECNLACAHCYRDTGRIDRLSLEDVQRVCENLPVRSVNLGTGENGLHPEFHAILWYLRDRGTTIALTSNGYTAAVLTDDELRSFADLEFSLDFATEREQDSWRGPGKLAARARSNGAGSETRSPGHDYRRYDADEL
jgi:MoaA/NifB/PqqE/SkfB family radical SAM enzyme